MAGKYLERAAGAKLGLYGNSPEEAVYPAYQVDEAGQKLDAGRFNYDLTFAKGDLPPVNAFWSLTLYDGRTRYLVMNPLDRYLINSQMLPDLKRNATGGVTLYLKHRSPGPERESNWLPAPDGPMFVVIRLYLPKPEVIKREWKTRPLRRVGTLRSNARARWFVLMCPLAQAQGHDAPGFIDEPGPAVAAVIDEAVAAGGYAFESQLSRRNRQTLSCKSNAGHFAGNGTRVIFGGNPPRHAPVTARRLNTTSLAGPRQPSESRTEVPS